MMTSAITMAATTEQAIETMPSVVSGVAGGEVAEGVKEIMM
jgi:hypothetical protein